MLTLRHYRKSDFVPLMHVLYPNENYADVERPAIEWARKEYNGKAFEMFTICLENEPIGKVTLYQHTESIVSVWPEIAPAFRHRGFGSAAMKLMIEIARKKGYKTVMQQIEVGNEASEDLHTRLGFQTSGIVYKKPKEGKFRIYLLSL